MKEFFSGIFGDSTPPIPVVGHSAAKIEQFRSYLLEDPEEAKYHSWVLTYRCRGESFLINISSIDELQQILDAQFKYKKESIGPIKVGYKNLAEWRNGYTRPPIHYELQAKAKKLISAYHYRTTTPLHKAIEEFSSEATALKTIQQLLTNKNNLEVKNNYGVTPLYAAVIYGIEPVVKMLLDGGANPNAKTTLGEGILHCAAARKSLPVVKILVDKGASLNSTDSEGRAPLHYAVSASRQEILQFLLSKGANPEVTDGVGNTGLHMVVRAGDKSIEIAKLLLSEVSLLTKNSAGATPLNIAILDGYIADNNNRINLIKLFLDKVPNLLTKDRENGILLLYCAIEKVDVKVVKLTLAAGVNPNGNATNTQSKNITSSNTSKNKSSRHSSSASESSSEESASDKEVMSHSKIASNSQLSPLSEAFTKIIIWDRENKVKAQQKVTTEEVKSKKESDSDSNSEEESSESEKEIKSKEKSSSQLSWMRKQLKDIVNDKEEDNKIHSDEQIDLKNRYEEIIELLLLAGANPNVTDKSGNQILHYYATTNNEKMMNLLHSCKADPNIPDNSGIPILLKIVQKGDAFAGVFQLLILMGAKIDVGDAKRATLLHLVAANNCAKLAEILINGGSDIEAKDSNRCTPLHLAVENGSVSVVKLLLEKKINLEARTKDDLTALHYAAKKSHSEIVEMLMVKGANPKATDNIGRTPLNYASDTGIVKLLGGEVSPSKVQTESPKQEVSASKVILHSEIKAYQPPKIAFSTNPHKPLATLEISFSIPHKELELPLNHELGRGGFGIVYKSKWRDIDVAIKQLQTTQLSSKALDEFKSETKIMASLNYPNIVRLFGITESVPYCIVMEYLPKGDLFNLLHSREQLNAEQIAKIALDIARGLAYLHQRKILHRDLKSKNILLDKDFQAKIGDFGLAKVRTETISNSSTEKVLGTLAWMAPEIIQGKTYTLKADIYSFGVILWELSAREVPYAEAHGNQVLIATWKSMGKKDEIPPETSKILAKLIESSWAQEPEKRPTAEHAIEQLQQGNSESVASINSSSEYRSNLDSTKSETYRMNFDSDDYNFTP